jgi:tetratricopeptide (TPR) repeat protein
VHTLVAVLSTAVLLAGCAATPQTRTLLETPPPDLPAAAELADTPFWPQERYQCGPAALATVLAARGVTVEPQQLVDDVYVPALHGTLPVEMAATARRYGMLAYRLQASLPALLTEIAAGNPVLVLQNLGMDWLPRWHFAVAIGYDLNNREIVLRSGTTRRWRTSLATFERTWSRGESWALVVLPAGRVPASADSATYLQAAHDLESADRSADALRAYRAAARRWPDDAAVWLALGNRLYASADYTAAQAAFRTATGLAPGDARGWNNLAYALLKTGCPLQARSAARCATRLAPEVANYRDTLEEIAAMATGRDAPECRPVHCEPPA